MTRQAGPSYLAGTAAFFLLLATVPATWAAQRPSSGVDALLAWKASLTDNTGLSSWTSHTPVTNYWVGVIGLVSIIELHLSGLDLSGRLDTLNIAALPALLMLDLAGNNLSGDIPKSFLRLRSLEILDLSNNRFHGSIPPPRLGNLQSLLDLRLYNNNLVGGVPRQLCRLVTLQVLDLSNNRLAGNLPDCWCNLQALQFMDLSKNRLTGELPNCWWNLQAMLYMDLSNNSFSGEIPIAKESYNCSLRSLYLAENGFAGAFPPVLDGCKSLSTIVIRNNMFNGGIPPWIGSQVPSLKILSLRSNNFTGEVPLELSQLSQLQLLDIANNSLTGSIPVAFGNLTSMRHPQNLSQDSSVPTVPLVPLYIKVSVDLQKYQDRIDIIWKGRDLNFQRTIWLLTGINFSGNSLSQCIPKELTNLQGLRFLNLSRNHLSCGIPEAIGSLNFFESLDISSNELSGAIPESIASISGLSTLNVSNNHLSGKIPTGTQMQTLTDPSFYSNNSGLCGYPLDIPCEIAKTSQPPNERNSEGEDQWLYFCVILGIVFGFWLWFFILFTIDTWRCAFLVFVDGMQCKVLWKVSY